MATCKDIEGWRFVSRLRPFDLTPCAEGIILSALLFTLLASAVIKLWLLSSLANRTRTSKSRWALRGKLVKYLLLLICESVTQMADNFQGIAGASLH